MLIERMIAASSTDPQDRRRSGRLSCIAEVALLWHHDPEVTLRYRILDSSDSGYRIHTQLPLPEGLSGTALRMLPEGRPLNQAVMVVWSRPDTEAGGYQVGLQSFSVQ